MISIIGATLLVTYMPGAQRVEGHAPHSGLNFSMELDTNGDNMADCGTGASQPPSCTAALNAAFRGREFLGSLGDIPAYRQLQLHFGYYDGVTYASDPDSVWPGCAAETFYFDSNFGHAVCSVAGSSPSIAYTGLVGQIFYQCTADGAVDLQHGTFPLHTAVTGEGGVSDRHAEGEQTFETLMVACQQPAPYPGDTDGDGCPDTKEAAATPASGGRRNFLSTYDYFNPSQDHLNRVDDIVAVVEQYFIDQGNPNYTAVTDRTVYGPNAWNTGPPNGLQRIDDIANIVSQYFHDCA